VRTARTVYTICKILWIDGSNRYTPSKGPSTLAERSAAGCAHRNTKLNTMSTCIDVVTPFNFDAPASVPANARKFPTLPLSSRAKPESKSVFRSAVRELRASSADLIDTPQLAIKTHISTESAFRRSAYANLVAGDDDALRSSYSTRQPAAPAPPVTVIKVTAEFVHSDAKHVTGKPTRIKIIDWKSTLSSSSSSSSSSASSSPPTSRSSSLASSAAELGREHDEIFPSVVKALRDAGQQRVAVATKRKLSVRFAADAFGVDDLAGTASQRASSKKSSSNNNDDDDGDPIANDADDECEEADELLTEHAIWARNRRMLRHWTDVSGGFDADLADPLGGLARTCATEQNSEDEVARIVERMEDF